MLDVSKGNTNEVEFTSFNAQLSLVIKEFTGERGRKTNANNGLYVVSLTVPHHRGIFWRVCTFPHQRHHGGEGEQHSSISEPLLWVQIH